MLYDMGRRASLLAASVLVVACATDRPTAPEGNDASVAAGKSPPSGCNFTTVRSDAQALFPSGSDPVFTLIRTMQSAYGTNNSTAATSPGFDVLQRVAAARKDGTETGAATYGGALTSDLLACMNVGTAPATADLSAAFANGIYEVRGSNTTQVPALAFAYAPGAAGGFDSPYWGAEAPSGWSGTYTGLGDTRFLVYGAAIASAGNTFINEPSFAFSENGSGSYSSFDVSTVPSTSGSPALVFANPLLLGVCVDQGTTAAPNLLMHGTSQAPQLLAQAFPSFCGDGFVPQSVASASTLSRILHGAATLLVPQTAYAFSIGGVGGLSSGLSPFGAVTVAAGDVVLTFTKQPKNGYVNNPIPVVVTATTKAGHPIPGLYITLTAVANNGSPVQTTDAGPKPTGTSGESLGVASFPNFSVSKAGGYALIAVGSFDSTMPAGTVTPPDTSSRFNVQNKTAP